MNTSVSPITACQWCGVIHLTAKCPQVKAIEYFENGTVKRVEFHDDKPQVGPAFSTNSPIT